MALVYWVASNAPALNLMPKSQNCFDSFDE
jgi:hypothetical protein